MLCVTMTLGRRSPKEERQAEKKSAQETLDSGFELIFLMSWCILFVCFKLRGLILFQKIVCWSFVLRTHKSFLFNWSKTECGCRGLSGLPRLAWENQCHRRVPSAHRHMNAFTGLTLENMPASF